MGDKEEEVVPTHIFRAHVPTSYCKVSAVVSLINDFQRFSCVLALLQILLPFIVDTFKTIMLPCPQTTGSFHPPHNFYPHLDYEHVCIVSMGSRGGHLFHTAPITPENYFPRQQTAGRENPTLRRREILSSVLVWVRVA